MLNKTCIYYAIVSGDYRRELRALAQIMGFEYLEA